MRRPLFILLCLVWFLACHCAGTVQAKSLAGIHAAVLSLPVFFEDRAPELAAAKAEQLKAIADAVRRHARHRDGLLDRKLAAFVVAWGWHETTYSLRVGDGRCHKWECDRGRARGPWQVHRLTLPADVWDRMHGLAHLDMQAAEATRRARGALGQCGGDVEGAFRALSGRGCTASLKLGDEQKRVETYRRVRARL